MNDFQVHYLNIEKTFKRTVQTAYFNCIGKVCNVLWNSANSVSTTVLLRQAALTASNGES